MQTREAIRYGQECMRYFRSALAILIAAFFIAACSSERQRPAGLFNVDSVIKVQVINLLAQEATIQKTARLNGKETTSSVAPRDTVEWEHELSIFLGLDVLNKPINKEQYISKTEPDPETELMVKSFSTTKKELPVKYLRVYYDQDLSNIQKIEASYHETNTLYKSARLLTMDFAEVDNVHLLSSYRITGGQKMFLDDSVEYEIAATIGLK